MSAQHEHDQRPADPAKADEVLKPNMSGHEAADAAVLAASRRRTRRSFVVAAAGAAAGYGFYRWIDQSDEVQMLPSPVRRALLANASVSRKVFDERALAPTYPVSRSERLRTNGDFGLKQDLLLASYRLQVVGVLNERQRPQYVKDVTTWDYRYMSKDKDSGEDEGHNTKERPESGAGDGGKMPEGADAGKKMTPGAVAGGGADGKPAAKPMPPEFEKAFADLHAKQGPRPPRGQEEAGESDSTLDPGTSGLLLTMDDVLKLPKHELVTQFKCIEGWSQVVHWGGVRMADFLETYPPDPIDGREPKYVYMETPNGDYYCGFDMQVCRHPQTLLVTEMAGKPLEQIHGAPLRLHMPTKYGYKQIKRIGLIAYTNDKPDDYWTKLGYDWYAGL